MKTDPRADKTVASRFGKVEGKKLHYLTAGQGPHLILLHGYTQTSRMWRPLIDKLKDKFTIFAPDRPGIGDSDIPKDGCDMKTAAIRIHALAKSIGVTKARVIGHDIGLMVAYAYVAQFSDEVEKLVVMDAFLPGVAGWELTYNSDDLWHVRFHGPTPEALVKGRERGRSNVAKRILLQAAAFNLALILRSLLKAGSPRSLADQKITFFGLCGDWWRSSCGSLTALPVIYR